MTLSSITSDLTEIHCCEIDASKHAKILKMFRVPRSYSLVKYQSFKSKCDYAATVMKHCGLNMKYFNESERKFMSEFIVERTDDLNHQLNLLQQNKILTHVPADLRTLEANVMIRSLVNHDYFFFVHPDTEAHLTHGLIAGIKNKEIRECMKVRLMASDPIYWTSIPRQLSIVRSFHR